MDDDIYHFTSGQTDARGRCQGDEFVVLRGSRIWLRPLPTGLAYIQRERDEHLQRGSIDAAGLVLEDIPLGSVSRAACFVHGADVAVKNTPYAWRNQRGERPPMGRSDDGGESGSDSYALPEVIDGGDRSYQVLPHNVDLAVKTYPLLVEAARQHKQTSYKSLAVRLGVHHRSIAHGLRIVQHWCASTAQPPLTVLVTGIQSHRPGAGYIEGSGDLERDLAAVHAHAWPRTLPFGSDIERASSPWEAELDRASGELEADDWDGNEFEPEDADEARERVLRSIARRRGQQKFRRTLLAAYEHQCAISGCQVEAVLEAAHILPYSQDGPNRPDNGVLLRADLHTLMDLDLLELSAEDGGIVRVRLAASLRGSAYEEFDGDELALPAAKVMQPSPSFIRRRWSPNR